FRLGRGHPASAIMNSVQRKAVSKTYDLDAVGVQALSDIDLDVRAERFTVISGASGSGKTTLLNLIGGIDRPDRGDIVIADQPIGTLSDDALSDFRARHIGSMFPNFILLPALTPYDN